MSGPADTKLSDAKTWPFWFEDFVLDVRIDWQRIANAFGRSMRGRMLDVFGRIHRENLWQSPETFSGLGSTLEWTAPFRDELQMTIRTLGARTLLDAPCGDLNWMRTVDLGPVRYVGADIVPELVMANRRKYGAGRRFLCLDLTRDRLPRADVILCRDCLVHLSLAEIDAALRNFGRSGATWLITTTFVDRTANTDIETGDWRPINLQLPPFDFPAPLQTIDERSTGLGGTQRDKRLGIWRLSDITVAAPI